ncbi:hypothetical protein [Lactococcus lactis]|uniref:hypothetical protein n=1 Tax=Lactococcus lactis TaxID=1358 RepID=UPI00207366A3|nr:hypothetical protein [Lactococcus lactis]
MKLSEIEAVSPEDFVVFEDDTAYSYTIDRGCRENAIEVDDFPKLYTAEQMQEYAKANFWELINWYVETTGDVNHAAEMKIWMDDEFGGHEK